MPKRSDILAKLGVRFVAQRYDESNETDRPWEIAFGLPCSGVSLSVGIS